MATFVLSESLGPSVSSWLISSRTISVGKGSEMYLGFTIDFNYHPTCVGITITPPFSYFQQLKFWLEISPFFACDFLVWQYPNMFWLILRILIDNVTNNLALPSTEHRPCQKGEWKIRWAIRRVYVSTDEDDFSFCRFTHRFSSTDMSCLIVPPIPMDCFLHCNGHSWGVIPHAISERHTRAHAHTLERPYVRKTCAHRLHKKVLHTDTFLHTETLPRAAFAHRKDGFCTEEVLRTEVFRHSSFCTQTVFRQKLFPHRSLTHKSFYAAVFTHRRFLHTKVFTQQFFPRRSLTRSFFFRHDSLYTLFTLHTDALHTDALAEKHF